MTFATQWLPMKTITKFETQYIPLLFYPMLMPPSPPTSLSASSTKLVPSTMWIEFSKFFANILTHFNFHHNFHNAWWLTFLSTSANCPTTCSLDPALVPSLHHPPYWNVNKIKLNSILCKQHLWFHNTFHNTLWPTFHAIHHWSPLHLTYSSSSSCSFLLHQLNLVK